MVFSINLLKFSIFIDISKLSFCHNAAFLFVPTHLV